jgi:hypothetical protein
LAASDKAVTRRLMPLYLANFLQGFVLWYTIEKLFMRHIGFDDAGIGIMVAAYSAIMLLVETPSGILADRWSRRGMLVVASVVLAIASWVGGISQGIPMYMVSAGCWGVFFALYSGTYDSMVYDTLLETKGHATDYERYYGRMKVADSLALVVGSILGGVLATQWGLRSPYFLTIPFALVSIVPLVLFKEPELHKKHAAALLTHHVRDTFRPGQRVVAGNYWRWRCADKLAQAAPAASYANDPSVHGDGGHRPGGMAKRCAGSGAAAGAERRRHGACGGIHWHAARCAAVAGAGWRIVGSEHADTRDNHTAGTVVRAGEPHAGRVPCRLDICCAAGCDILGGDENSHDTKGGCYR